MVQTEVEERRKYNHEEFHTLQIQKLEWELEPLSIIQLALKYDCGLFVLHV